MSDGIRSGVNCTRLASRPSVVPSVSTSLVLARPGTPISSAWPPDRIVTSVFSMTRSWPKMTVRDGIARGANVARDLFGGADDHVFQFLDSLRQPSQFS